MPVRRVLRPVVASAPIAMCTPLAQAGPSDVQIDFVGEIGNQFEWDGTFDDFGNPVYVDTGINESFVASGGLELLPFQADGWGGVMGGFPYPEENIAASGSVESIPENGTEFRMAGASSIQEVLDYPTGGPLVSVALSFTVTQPTAYELFVHDFFYSNDTGAGGVGLYDSDGNIIAATKPLFDIGLIGEGALNAGTYRVNALAYGNADFDFSLRLFPIPAPGTGTLLAGLGWFALHRRRR
ncbi:hypothetical protein ABWH91_13520 [Phycisphaerales bacterium ac7]